MKRLIKLASEELPCFELPADLLEYEDKIGDMMSLTDYPEEGEREFPFLYFNKKIIWGKSGETHVRIWSEMVKELEGLNKNDFYNAQNDTEKLAKFGLTTGTYSHGVCTFRDNYISINATTPEVIRSLQNSGKPIKKIYECLNVDDLMYKRVASRRLKKTKTFKRVM